MINWEYWYIFPASVIIAMTANATGFSGGVFFQPFFYFGLNVPLINSIATGIATETLGMTSGAWRYAKQKMLDRTQITSLLLYIFLGVFLGLFVFSYLPAPWLRLIVGLVVFAVATYQMGLALKNRFGFKTHLRPGFAKKYWLVFLSAGCFSACTGTGVAEVSQPMLEQKGKLTNLRANATAVFLEACADWLISLFNLTWGNISLDVLLFSGTGVIIGAQLGAKYAYLLPAKLLKVVFSVALLSVSLFYLYTFVVYLYPPSAL
ncbi:MAG: sulfite exporter TauE/SafE family protein [Bdellovibrio sp.]|nr:sulfite exporter TauE/SafE family protein [Bdellovibrio sp.]